jgi:hypothetical protein
MNFGVFIVFIPEIESTFFVCQFHDSILNFFDHFDLLSLKTILAFALRN